MRKDNTSAMRVALDELLEWFGSNAPNCLAHLCSGASDEDITAVEKQTGLIIPDDYMQFLRLHDGEDGTSWNAILGEGNQLLSCESIINQFKMNERNAKFYDPMEETIEFWKKTIDEDGWLIDGPVKPLNICPNWLPLTCMNGDVYRYFDYDPAPGGIAGQIIEIDPECLKYEVIANTFSELLENHVADLKSGVYKVDEDHNLERIKFKEIVPCIPEWLTN